MADNIFTSKDAYDAMELGVNQYMLSMEGVSLALCKRSLISQIFVNDLYAA
jgi:hypothetical protein